ncbi:protein trachealess-like isoform X1 [Anopheles funestus]|uniref:protein trachealess-like isoform X1 n=1 Tax=Anopheles funestus TaxID=62324 RepID=UPI0020C71403|nr:protein trachealess-like isoform X1 [Anopheles funestus]XP_049295056.1 protein trachealess-like isoform X1 [Anopheles funestus]XP_049295057.1 protein trachealess-like isoform X1 [Anopheles funestus]XP_049295058.1 protein trachealess-like isoform X1 [Anopheles funestus]XP_049295059.1 protein trachealess-like isoform X1 [Anopheles funestus]
MNISTEYAPTDGMNRSYHTRSSYHSRYYAGSGSPGPGNIPPYTGAMDGHHSRRHHEHSPTTMVGSFGDTGGSHGSEKPFYAPPPLGSDSYASSGPDERHPAYLANYYGAAGYSQQGMLRMPPEHGVYGGCYGTPPIPWYHQQHSSYHHHPHHGHHHSHQQQQHQQHSVTPRSYPMPPEHMYNMFNFNRNGREARNRAEKNRRDKLNGSIQELSAMVPHVAESPRRVDKTAVLRFSAHGLRVDYVFGKSKPDETVKPEAQDSLFRMLNGFLLTVTCRGQIVLVSPSVEQFLGHCQTDLYGQNLFNLTHPDDHALLKQQLIPSNLVNMFDNGPGTSSSNSGGTPALLSPTDGATANGTDSGEFQRTHDEEEDIDKKLRLDHRRFSIRMARAGPRSESTTYELVTINGSFRRADAAPRGTTKPGGTSGMQMIRRARGRDDAMPLHSINGNDIVLIGLARVMKMPSICDRLIEACKYEYKTRHLIDGRIVQCDQRISIVAGYLTDEVSGLSPFTFMHRDDVRWVIVALRQMYDYNQNGESCYRLMSRTGDFIYLKTRGYLEVDSDTKVVQSFVCINTLVSEEEGQRLVREMKRKFSVIVDKVELPDESGEPVVENPKQIEEAVLNLITNLQPDSEDKLLNTMPASPASSIKSGFGEGAPLAIVAPEKNSVKSAIVKSINVVSIAAKTMRETRCSSVSGEWSPMDGDQQNSNGSSSTSTTGVASPCALGTDRGGSSSEPISSPPPPSLSPAVSVSTAHTQRPTVLQKTDPTIQLMEEGAGGANVEQRVPPLPSSEHYFTQPFSPSSSGGTVPVSLLSPASSHYSQRNSRSPYGGCGGGIASPPAALHSGSGGGLLNRSTSVLKRTYSNSSISSLNSLDTFGDGDVGTGDSKRTRMNLANTDLVNCFSDLINPGTDLTSLLPNSFDALDQSLLTMETTTTFIRDRVSNYSNLHESQDRLERIVEEHQEQREMLQSIQEEYQLQMQSNGTGDAIGAVAVHNEASGGGLATNTTAASHLFGSADGMLCNSLTEGPLARRRVSTITTTTTTTSMMPSVITSTVVQRTPNGGNVRSEKDAGS